MTRARRKQLRRKCFAEIIAVLQSQIDTGTGIFYTETEAEGEYVDQIFNRLMDELERRT